MTALVRLQPLGSPQERMLQKGAPIRAEMRCRIHMMSSPDKRGWDQLHIPHVQTPILLRRYINAVRTCTTRVLGSPFHTLILVIRIHHGLQFAFERF